jgi:uncharacterized protein (DUF2141 family)
VTPVLLRGAAAAMLIGAAAPSPGAGAGGTLTLDVSNVRNAKGRVHVDICPETSFLKEDCPYSATAPARIGTTVVTVTGLPPGRYAAQVFHDENLNNKVDRVIFGLPKEGVGFSNDAPIRMSPPKWRDAQFDFAGGAQTISLKIRYFLGASGPKR